MRYLDPLRLSGLTVEPRCQAFPSPLLVPHGPFTPFIRYCDLRGEEVNIQPMHVW